MQRLEIKLEENKILIPKTTILGPDGKAVELPSEMKERKRTIRHQGEKEKARRLRQIAKGMIK